MKKTQEADGLRRDEFPEPDRAPAYEGTFDLRTGEMEWEEHEERREHHHHIADVVEAMPVNAGPSVEAPAHEMRASVLDAALVAGALAGKLVYEKAKGLFQGEDVPPPSHDVSPSLNPDPITPNTATPMSSIAPDPRNRLEHEGPSPATMGDSSKPPTPEHDLSKISGPSQAQDIVKEHLNERADQGQSATAEQGQQQETSQQATAGSQTQEQGEFKLPSRSEMKEQALEKLAEMEKQREQERNQEQETKQQQTQSR